MLVQIDMFHHFSIDFIAISDTLEMNDVVKYDCMTLWLSTYVWISETVSTEARCSIMMIYYKHNLHLSSYLVINSYRRMVVRYELIALALVMGHAVGSHV